jgi:hypothetical protein
MLVTGTADILKLAAAESSTKNPRFSNRCRLGYGVDRDVKAYVAFLDDQPQTDRNRGAGVQG